MNKVRKWLHSICVDDQLGSCVANKENIYELENTDSIPVQVFDRT